MRFLCQSAALLVLLCVSVYANEDGKIAEAGHEAQGMADSASEKLSNAAETVKDKAKAGYDSVSTD